MKKTIFTIWTVISLLFPFVSNAQSQYKDKSVIECANEKYLIKYRNSFLLIENSKNTLLDQVIYKVDSNPRQYYYDNNELWADIDTKAITEEIERTIFSGNEWDDYYNNPGFIDVTMAVNPSDGRVLEVEFILDTQYVWDGVRPVKVENINQHIYGVPIERLHSIECFLKEKVVCQVKEESKSMNLSYVRSGFGLFYNPNVPEAPKVKTE